MMNCIVNFQIYYVIFLLLIYSHKTNDHVCTFHKILWYYSQYAEKYLLKKNPYIIVKLTAYSFFPESKINTHEREDDYKLIVD